LAKYAALLFVVPVFCILACLALTVLGWRAAFLRAGLAVLSFFLSLVVAYQLIDKAALHAIAGSTTNRETILSMSRFSLLGTVLRLGGLIFLLSAAGLLLLLFQRRLRIVAILFFATSWLAPLYHIYTREFISLDKHIAYGLFFAVPLAGYAIAWLSGYEREPFISSSRGYWLAALAVLVALLTLGIQQAQDFNASWANTSSLSYDLHTQFRDGTGRILAEDIETVRFDARDITQEWQWNGLRFPYYVDAAGKQLLGDPALAQALTDRYYDFVELSFNAIADEANFVAERMVLTRNYDLIAVIPFENSFGKGHFYLFRSAIAAGQGDFTSLQQLKSKVWS
jgi:hypothetical protein